MANETEVPDVWNMFEEMYCGPRMTHSRGFWKQTNPQTVEGLERKVGTGWQQRGSHIHRAEMGNKCYLAGGRFSVPFIVVETELKSVRYAGTDPGSNEN